MAKVEKVKIKVCPDCKESDSLRWCDFNLGNTIECLRCGFNDIESKLKTKWVIKNEVIYE